MTPEERKLMIAMGKQITDIDQRLKLIEQTKNAGVSNPIPPPKAFKTASNAANKFFGINPHKQEINARVVCKEPLSTDGGYNQEVEKATELFKKAINEFCKEYQIKEFTLQYIDDTPKIIN